MMSWLKDTYRFLRPFIVVAVLLLIWQFAVPALEMPDYVLPLPSKIAARFWLTRSVQLQHLSITALTTIVGLGCALVVGVLLALAVIYVELLRATVLPILAAFNSIPKIAIAPLFIIWFGLGLESKIVLAFLLSLFPIFVNSVTGLGEIEPDMMDLAKLSGGTPWRIFLKVRLMNAVPYLLDALKVALPLALVGSVVGEFIGGNTGVGFLVMSGQFNLDTALVFATLFSITMFTTVCVAAVSLSERVFLKWRPSRRTR